MSNANGTNKEQAAAPQLLRISQVKAKTGLSRSGIYRLTAQGDFPRRIKLTERASAWNSIEVEKWVADRIAARDQGGAS